MSLSTMFGNIVDVQRPAGNWKDSHGTVHAVIETAMRQDDEADDQAVTDSWNTVCEVGAWEEKSPRLTKLRVTCLLCLGLA